MSEYIEIRKAAEMLCKMICGNDRGLCVSKTENCMQSKMVDLYNIEAADVAPVVHGRWVRENMVKLSCTITYVCQMCSASFSIRSDLGDVYNYCPNCGAKMDLNKR